MNEKSFRSMFLWFFIGAVLVGFLAPGFQQDPQKMNSDAPANVHSTPYLGTTENVVWSDIVERVQNHPNPPVGQILLFRVEGSPVKWVANLNMSAGKTLSVDAPNGEADVKALKQLIEEKNKEMTRLFEKTRDEMIAARKNGTNPYTKVDLVEESFNPVTRQFTDEHPLPVKVIGLEGGGASGGFMDMVWGMLPFLFIFAFIYVLMRQRMGGMQDSNGKAMEFAKSKAQLIESTGKTLADFEGDDNVKQEVQSLVAYLRKPGRVQRMGGKLPRGVLMIGPPGTGKTLLAKAIAGEAGVPFFSISGSDFVEMFVGVGSARVRDMFAQAKGKAPCIIFIDEIDAIGRQRGAGLGGGHDEREQTLNAILVEMDGFGTNDTVIVIAATNRPDVLDPALLRPGRFGDLQITVGKPDRKGRLKILGVHKRNKPLNEDALKFLDELAAKTTGFSGAELEGMLNHAALVAAYRIDEIEQKLEKEARALTARLTAESRDEFKIALGAKLSEAALAMLDKAVVPEDITKALVEAKLTPDQLNGTIAKVNLTDRIKKALEENLLSPEQIKLRLPPEEITVADLVEGKWRVMAGTRGAHEMTDEQKLNTAVHELGHAFQSEKDYQEGTGGDPVREINCIQRSRALGVTVASPDHDVVCYTDRQILARVRMGMGGRAAQQEILGTIDTGAANDFEQATGMVREYVMRYGMDEEVGPISVGEQQGSPFLGKAMAATQSVVIGDQLKDLIDLRMRTMTKQAMSDVRALMSANREIILEMAKQLARDESWTRKDWLEQLRSHGCAEKFKWAKLEYVEYRPEANS